MVLQGNKDFKLQVLNEKKMVLADNPPTMQFHQFVTLHQMQITSGLIIGRYVQHLFDMLISAPALSAAPSSSSTKWGNRSDVLAAENIKDNYPWKI